MAKNNIGDTLKNTLQGAAESVKTAAKDVKLPELKAPEKIKDAFKKKEVPVSSAEQTSAPARINISVYNAMKIIYYFMAVDGEVHQSEEEKFNSICAELDPEFTNYYRQIIDECKMQMDKVIDADDYYDVIQEGVEDTIMSAVNASDIYIPPKLLVWNLLAIAHSDEKYDEPERKLLKYIVRKLDVDRAVFLELESSFLTVMDLEKELLWVKTTDRPYLSIEVVVNEIADRKNAVFTGVRDLVLL